MSIQEKLQQQLKAAVQELDLNAEPVEVTHSTQASQGDYATNIALLLAKEAGKNPRKLAEQIVQQLSAKGEALSDVDEIEVAGPGFINFFLKQEYFLGELKDLVSSESAQPVPSAVSGKKIMVEYAHPNTHKEMHIGHMRTLITGEAIARLLEAAGATVFRANYQGDIGPHVAKAIYGVRKLLAQDNLSLEAVEKWDAIKKARFLGQAYALGNTEYEEHKDEIDGINTELYRSVILSGVKDLRDSSPSAQNDTVSLYQVTRQWSLDYYDEFYKRFYTQFDRLFFESQMVSVGKQIVEENVGKVFRKENGAIIFPGEAYGLHTRVFLTQAGNPTYEGKEMGNAFAEYEAFPFDLKMHIVANEQTGYFQVVFKALELIAPEKFKDKQYHLSMGMVQLKDPSAGSGQARKMSSRTGDVLTVDWLLDQVKAKVEELMAEGAETTKLSSSPASEADRGRKIESPEKDTVVEQITIGAVKHSVLKVNTAQDAAFDIERSVSLEGESGPYLQYTFARTQSVLRKAEALTPALSPWEREYQGVPSPRGEGQGEGHLEPEELSLLKLLARFDETIAEAAEKYSPNLLSAYLFDLAQAFNLFYQKQPILKAADEQKALRLALTKASGNVLKRGLNLLGIQAPERM